MPAAPSRIGFITQEFRVATAGPISAVEALYGNAARDTSEPLETFFDDPADAQVMADERLALLSARRSLVTVTIEGVDTALSLDRTTALPTVRIIDDEQGRNSRALAVGVTIDLNTGRSTLETWGIPGGAVSALAFVGSGQSGDLAFTGAAQAGPLSIEESQ